jgi:hypothetical protein
MAVSDWVPIVSVVATATVGLGVPIVTARFDREKIRDQADEGCRDELRAVIDKAGAHLTATISALDDAMNLASESARTDVMDDEAEAARWAIDVDAYREKVQGLWTCENQTAVRVGSADDLHKSYADATTQLGQAFSPLSERCGFRSRAFASIARRSRGSVFARNPAFTTQPLAASGSTATDTRKLGIVRSQDRGKARRRPRIPLRSSRRPQRDARGARTAIRADRDARDQRDGPTALLRPLRPLRPTGSETDMTETSDYCTCITARVPRRPTR